MEQTKTLTLVNTFVLVAFVMDIAIQFFTSYLIVALGEEVTKPKMIAIEYLLSFDFIVDFLSTFPFD